MITMKQSPTEYYKSKTDEMSVSLKKRKEKTKYFIAAEITLFFCFVAGVAVLFSDCEEVTRWAIYICCAFFFVCFILVKRADRKNQDEVDVLANRIAVCRAEMEYLSGKLHSFDDGKRYIDPDHQYTYDMDVFGEKSLYQRICRAVTTGGADRLAEILSSAALGNEAAASLNKARGDIMYRRGGIDELAAMSDWRVDFLALGSQGRIDTHKIEKAIETMSAEDFPEIFAKRRAVALVGASIVVFVSLLLFSTFTSLSGNIPALWLVLQLWVSITVSSKALKKASTALEGLSASMMSCMKLIEHVANTKFSSDINREIAATLCGTVEELKEMRAILNAIDRRGNILGLVVFNAFAFSDVFLVRRFMRWTQRNREHIASWISQICQIDVLVSMATYRFNETETVMPEIVEEREIILEAKAIRHPFLGSKAVGNDFVIRDRHYYIITGANMAGKSTFLRSLGTNYILAMCGLPVFASSMRVSVFSLFSSMRTNDNLSHGISYFNAELLRLEYLLKSVRRQPRTLIILDEILKGTNSIDKLNGSRMFLEAITKMPVSGIIATHDLELSKLADDFPDRFDAYCFEIELAADINYSYKITHGTAHNQNATYLLKRILASND